MASSLGRQAGAAGQRSSKPAYLRHVPFLTGLGALIWFLLRVVPKPTRATYPCQQVAMPLAGGFVAWLLTVSGGFACYRAGRRHFERSHVAAATICVMLAALLGGAALFTAGEAPVLAWPDPPNEPIGIARGVQPGRVVWVHDPDATDWAGPGDGHWWEPDHTDQLIVDEMMRLALLSVSGASTSEGAWDALFRHFNQVHGHGNVGYTPGERITIKLNLVGCHAMVGGVDPVSYDLVDRVDYMNTSPQMVLAVLRQLIETVGVSEADISVGDPTALYPNQYHDHCHAEYPGVRYFDRDGGTAEHPRVQVQYSTVPVYWSCHPTGGDQDYVPQCYADAAYVINLAHFKSHGMAGVTLVGKNHFGSLIRYPFQSEYYDMHESMPSLVPEDGSYRILVDLLGHDHLGGKTVLYLVDGLYSGVSEDETPRRWVFPPFSWDWTSSLFVSQDPLAIESVCFDFLQEEGDPRYYPQRAGADDHLTEAALADDPPSGTFYDPNHAGDVERLASLGVHEHWNNSTDRQYSRNLGTGDGIELVTISGTTAIAAAAPAIPAAPTLTTRPNPFNPSTTIVVELATAAETSVRIHDVSGRVIRTLFDGVGKPRTLEFHWDGTDQAGRPLASGTYFCRLENGASSLSSKLVIAR